MFIADNGSDLLSEREREGDALHMLCPEENGQMRLFLS